jgi:hypothetical protein
VRFNAGRVLVTVFAIACAGLAVGITGSGATSTHQNGAKVSAQTAIDWNKIAVSTVLSPSLSPTKFQIEGLVYMAYVQAAEYDAVTAISGR